ncbi:AMP-binding protein [Sulfitobacter sp. TSTF-M16]|uniref:AMP-binding protein n=1 Tax=Sulfitobacter aestuariivivens TaxID=2766981 RepID=A0A927HG62_9RHOB|nr:AMP-binding protein [Sulfitobacter aestuariivivens]MBD3665139.1 AMP-binding protein [Sulfitobacter aestuariivivens]
MKLHDDRPPEGTVRDWLNVRADAGGTAFRFPVTGETLSWAELRDHAARIAAHLTAQGISKGESVALLNPNGRDAVLSVYGVLYGGFRATMINLIAGNDAIAYALEHSEARFAVVDNGARALFMDVAHGITPLDLEGSDPAPLHAIGPDDAALLMYTSGTTGRPKGVVHSHASLLAGGWTTAIAHALTPRDCGLCVLPIYHINGLCVSVMGGLVSGGTVAMVPKFSASQFWTQAQAAQATWFSVVPTIISHLLHSTEDPTDATRRRLRFGRSASSPLAPDVQTAFEARFDVPIVETMGLTETAAQILSNPLPPGTRKIGSPGVAYGNEACIMSADLEPLPAEKEGEICVRGPNVMREYFKNPQATLDTFTPEGWLRTGDLGRIDADGYLFVTGRLKELIIKGGENIAPREIDEALYSHADVIEAAAFARPCDSYGERVEAAVKIKKGSALTAHDLVEICCQKIGAFKAPDVVHVLDDLPKGPSGKIQRLKIAELTRNA